MVYCGRGIFLILSEFLSASGSSTAPSSDKALPVLSPWGRIHRTSSIERKIHTMIVSRTEEDNPRLFDRKKLHKQRQLTDIPPTKRKCREHHPLSNEFTRGNFLFCPS
ncbi:hypothetical protein [Porphyromonas gulae]|uniref:hypothetical protein n=1 Tax=Porphyromonas gulae TaxID=111105 RepID=UPI00139233A0|nr:hypothetical protein [Porphyromonas gulae]